MDPQFVVIRAVKSAASSEIGRPSTAPPVPQTSGQQIRKGASIAYEGLKQVAQALSDFSDVFPPLKTAVNIFLKIDELVNRVSTNQEELQELQTKLNAITSIVEKYKNVIYHRIETFCNLTFHSFKPSSAIVAQANTVKELCEHQLLQRIVEVLPDVDKIQKVLENMNMLCNVFQKSLSISTPVRSVRVSLKQDITSYKIIVIDALDECTDLDRVSAFLKYSTSRDEDPIWKAFRLSSDIRNDFVLHEVEKDVFEGDIRIYLASELKDHRTSTLFIYDATARCPSFSALVHSEGNEMLALRCLQLMNTRLRYNICDAPKERIISRREITNSSYENKSISAALRYSCVYWASHFSKVQQLGSDLVNALDDLLKEHLLHWMECLSLLNKLETGVDSLANAGTCLSAILPNAIIAMLSSNILNNPTDASTQTYDSFKEETSLKESLSALLGNPSQPTHELRNAIDPAISLPKSDPNFLGPTRVPKQDLSVVPNSPLLLMFPPLSHNLHYCPRFDPLKHLGEQRIHINSDSEVETAQTSAPMPAGSFKLCPL
ncbi:hypothetical protein K435DRAFT_799474 [Dendrothele bispora CBS 962.96]|uniref:NACHT-NTPase and P-loop NTPases N-terminal domain-containing protein n=1 Tax=Dendrothele bispora (strain CBS 962.96) TaxID=1314807 RepID=A0A4S8LX26_DENBC|nr:hypothetical protein K435DRAFT_799474 [Dendrothele bispora CBS 962.96]